MANIAKRDIKVQTDVLCVGGGIAGLMAAIRASELGVKVVVAEKGNALYSGSGGAGNDHFWCYLPEAHGSDLEAFLEECLKGPKMGVMLTGASLKVLRIYLEKSFDIVKLWDSWGIPMKYQGRWEFAGHSFPGETLTHLKYAGKGQKRVLLSKAMGKGVNIINRVMVFDLLSGENGDIVGAIAVDTRDDKIIIFEAKSIILGTGGVDRLYPPPVPGWLASIDGVFTNVGDGRAMAYRAGAELVGMERLRRHAGPRYFYRGGQATWIGVLRDPLGKPLGPFVTKPDRRYGDMTMEVNSLLLEDYMKSGVGPVYMDCTGISDEDYKYMMYWLVHEGNASLINHAKEEGIDFRRNPIEFGTFHIQAPGKVRINEKAETLIKGLYASGDESIGGIGAAATYGWIAGENAANHAKEKSTHDMERCTTQIEEKESLFNELRYRKMGPDWKEANVALQQIMYDYAGLIRSETMLKAGLDHLRRLKKKVNATLMAKNQWDLTRCLEIFNLLDIGEVIFLAANEAKETRGLHKRTDYPLTNPMLEDKLLFIRRAEGKPLVEWRKIE